MTRTVLQPRWGWKTLAAWTQGSLADSATAGLIDGIPLGYSEERVTMHMLLSDGNLLTPKSCCPW